jgi:hypothetical protein
MFKSATLREKLVLHMSCFRGAFKASSYFCAYFLKTFLTVEYIDLSKQVLKISIILHCRRTVLSLVLDHSWNMIPHPPILLENS